MGPSVKWRVVRSEGPEIPIQVERAGQVLEFRVAPIKEQTKAWQRKPLREILIEPAHTAIINAVVPNGPAARAGLRRGDAVLAVNGQRLFSNAGLGDYLEKHGATNLTLTIARDSQTLAVRLQPEVPLNAPDARPRLGILWDMSGGRMTLAHPGVVEQVAGSIEALISTFGALFSRKSDIKPQHLSGPAKIINIYYVLFQSEQGWRLALWFSVILNVNLALLNLLPIPVLDGGHITLALVEGIRRKPVNARVLNVVQTACAALIIGYMLYITFYDVQDTTWRQRPDRLPDMKFAPQGTGQPAPVK
jgi:regulator of sigma E protease